MPGTGGASGGGGGGSSAGALGGRSSVRSKAAARQSFTLTWVFPGHANRREGILKALVRYDAAGGTNLNQASDIVVPLATEQIRDQDFFGPVESNTSAIRVTKAGRYRVTYACAFDNATIAAGGVKTWLRKNGATDLPGSHSGAVTAIAQPRGHGAASVILDLAANDYLELFGRRSGTSAGNVSTIADGSMVTVELLSYANEAVLGGGQVAPRAGVLQRVAISKGVSGWSGTTRLRMLKNAVSMMGSNDMPILASQNYAEFGTEYHSTYHIDPGDVLTLDVRDEESPYPRDLVVTATFAAIG